MWTKTETKDGAKWLYSVAAGGTGDMPVFELGGSVEEDRDGEHLNAYDKKHGFINAYLELDDAKKAVEEAAHGRKYF